MVSFYGENISVIFFVYVGELVDEAHPERISGNLVISQTNNSEGNMLGARKVVLHFFCICFSPQFATDKIVL